ncbi:hypothetical protein [Serratia marcescens]|uniref:hypothetical protein n=1 Tax=Serratia marcescens TaxID=615 RepID=UPI0018E24102|nr:hypothetical protein [Serratia marcescens]
MTLTTERLKWLHDAATELSATKLKVTMRPDELLVLTSELLANREAQPAGYSQVQRDMMKDILVRKLGGNLLGEKLCMDDIHAATMELIKAGFRLYTAPSAPAVPGGIGIQEAKELFNYLMTEEELNATVNGYNACRAEMLAQSVSQGYKLVPVEPTAKQWAAGVKAMDSGIDKVTLVYKAMLETAPTQGKNNE